MKNPKVSVIMPLYNSEKYIPLALKSLINQSFRDFEAILIDDCSTDKTLAVAKKFKDKRIKIIQNEINLGMPGAVRNVGLNIAKGKYLYFFDNDDVMLPNCLEILVNEAEKFKADMVHSTISLHAESDSFNSLNDVKVKAIQTGRINPVSSDIKQRIREEILMRYTHCALWISLYRRDFINTAGGGYRLDFQSAWGRIYSGYSMSFMRLIKLLRLISLFIFGDLIPSRPLTQPIDFKGI